MKIKNGIFELSFRYNEFVDGILVDLYSESGELIHCNETMVQGMPLWYSVLEDSRGNLNPKYPDAYFQPLSIDGREYPVNLANLEENIFLTIRDRSQTQAEFDFLLYK